MEGSVEIVRIQSTSADENAKNKISTVRDHSFKETFFRQPHFCCHCGEMIYGLGRQGCECQSCNLVVHKRCHKYVNFTCRASDKSDKPVDDLCEHSFEAHFFTKPTFCDHCGSLIYGLVRQGMQCTSCDMNIHYRCQSHIPSHCGINYVERSGRILLKAEMIKKSADKYCLSIHIKRAVNLTPCNMTGTADAYVSAKLIPQNKRSEKKKTSIRRSTRNPEWNESIEVPVRPQDKFKRLLICVRDWDITPGHNLLGCLSFSVEDISKKSIEGWFKLLDYKDGQFFNVQVPHSETEDVTEFMKKSLQFSCHSSTSSLHSC